MGEDLNTKEVEQKVKPDDLSQQTREILEVTGVDLLKVRDMRWKVSRPRSSSGPAFSLTWVPDYDGGIDEIQVNLNDDPTDSDLARISLISNFGGRGKQYKFSHANSGHRMGDTERKNLERQFGEGAEVIFKTLAAPFSRLAFAQQLVSIAPKAPAK